MHRIKGTHFLHSSYKYCSFVHWLATHKLRKYMKPVFSCTLHWCALIAQNNTQVKSLELYDIYNNRNWQIWLSWLLESLHCTKKITFYTLSFLTILWIFYLIKSNSQEIKCKILVEARHRDHTVIRRAIVKNQNIPKEHQSPIQSPWRPDSSHNSPHQERPWSLSYGQCLFDKQFLKGRSLETTCTHSLYLLH